ncbi:MAG: DUF3592 domain-containing protein [Elusimicrobia bacterium]|nr:DUF3592 domain-containing protein [Elusimicrobiota bacterium]
MEERQYDAHSAGRDRALAFRGNVILWIQRAFKYLGLLMLLIMGAFLWKLWSLYSGGVTAGGKIAGFQESRGADSPRAGRGGGDTEYVIYYPVVRFEAEGKSLEFVSNHGARGGPAYRVGQEVEVVYLPGQPQKAELARSVRTFSVLWLNAVLFFAAGLFFLLTGRWLFPRLANRFHSYGAEGNG